LSEISSGFPCLRTHNTETMPNHNPDITKQPISMTHLQGHVINPIGPPKRGIKP